MFQTYVRFKCLNLGAFHNRLLFLYFVSALITEYIHSQKTQVYSTTFYAQKKDVTIDEFKKLYIYLITDGL